MPRRPPEERLFAGRYKLEQELGRGGFGTVHRAWDTKAERRVALKIVDKRSLELAGGMHRFHREASVLMRLTHPNVVRAYDAGEADGMPYLVLELLEGVSLEAALRDHGAMPPERVAAITRDLLGALAEAHARGVVHRDVKPANVFLTAVDVAARGDSGTRLLDFGIAKADGLDAAQTAMGATLGTAAYMAPEQITGGVIRPQTDLFAVGLLMAEMIAGRRIYTGSSGLAILVEKANGRPVELPAAVKESPFGPIVARAVQIDPDKRFGSAAEMRALLERAEGVRISSAPRASLASAPPRDSPLPEAAVPGPNATQPSALDATAPQPQVAPPSPLLAGGVFVPAHAGDTAASAIAAPGPTQLREIGHAETATFEAMPVAATPHPPKSRRGLLLIALVVVLVVASSIVSAWMMRTGPRKPKPRGARIEVDPDKPLVLEDGRITKILPGNKPATIGGITVVAGNSPPQAQVECAELATLSPDEVDKRLRTLGKVTVGQRGQTISLWTVPCAVNEDGSDVSLYDLDSVELAREVARRLRPSGPVLVGGKRVVEVDDDATLAAVQKAVCHP